MITSLILAAGIAVFAIGIGARVADLHFNTVLSNSMKPTFSAGDVVVTEPVPVGSLRVGDVIAFIPPTETRPVVHRIASIQNGVITTRGDVNTANDPWQLTATSMTADRLIAVIPLIGWLSQIEVPLLLLAGLLAGLEVVRVLGKGVVSRRKRLQPQPQS